MWVLFKLLMVVGCTAAIQWHECVRLRIKRKCFKVSFSAQAILRFNVSVHAAAWQCPGLAASSQRRAREYQRKHMQPAASGALRKLTSHWKIQKPRTCLRTGRPTTRGNRRTPLAPHKGTVARGIPHQLRLLNSKQKQHI